MQTYKTAFVTGAASGMGGIIARRLANRGTTVVAADRNAEGLKEFADGRDNVAIVELDIADSAAVASAFADAVEAHGPIDAVFHCAAIMPTKLLIDQDQEMLERLFAINMIGTSAVTNAALGHMLEQGRGDITIFGSIAGEVPVPEAGAYCATKAAVNMYAEVLIDELRDSPVHVMLVCPPMVNTPLLQQAVETSNPKAIADSIEKQRFADPEQIVDAVEKGLEKRTTVLLPHGEAKALKWARRLAPGLLRRVIRLANKE